MLYTTIRPKIRVFIYLFVLCAHDHSTQILWFSYIYYFFCARPFDEDLGYHLFIFLYAHNHLVKICGPLPFIITFVHDHSTKKNKGPLHDHSNKIRGHSYSLIYSLIHKLCIYFVRYIHGSAGIFRTLYLRW